nr:PaaX family transcriptional regulator C-terminal domain-containing protein [Actinomadura mexicana]
MRLIHDYRHFPFRDPDLPTELLPAGWLGRDDAHELFLEPYHLLKQRAEEQFERLWEEVGS